MNNKKMIVVFLLGISFLMMYGLFFKCEIKIWQIKDVKVYFNYLLKENIVNLVIMIVMVLIPYERLAYIWKKDLYNILFLKPEINKRRILAEGIFVYVGVASILYLLWDSLNVNLADAACLVLTLINIYLIACSYNLVEHAGSHFVVVHILIVMNGGIAYIFSESLYNMLFVMLASILVWQIGLFIFNKKNKFPSLAISLIFGVGIFYKMIEVSKTQIKFLNGGLPGPAKYIKNDYWLQEKAWLSRHTLKLSPGELPRTLLYRHPFAAAYHLFGIGAVIMLFAIFIIITVAVMMSCKNISKKRVLVLLSIYFGFALLFLVTFASDMGFFPIPSLLLMKMPGLPTCVFVSRLLVVKKVPEKTKSWCSSEGVVIEEEPRI